MSGPKVDYAKLREQEMASLAEAKVYYQFEGIPSQEVLDKLYEYSERYGGEVIIDTEPLGILN